MLKIVCPFCSTEVFRPAKACNTCSAQITYGGIPSDAFEIIGIGAVFFALAAMHILPKFGIRHPLVTFFLTIGLVAMVSYWRASSIFKDAVSWKRATEPREGIASDGLWQKAPFELKLRQGFKFYHQEKFGYYPTTNANGDGFAVRSAQDKWELWRLFFKNRRKQVMAINSPLDMRAIYLDVINSKDRNVAEELIEGTPLLREHQG